MTRDMRMHIYVIPDWRITITPYSHFCPLTRLHELSRDKNIDSKIHNDIPYRHVEAKVRAADREVPAH